jgi:hypothetical protein
MRSMAGRGDGGAAGHDIENARRVFGGVPQRRGPRPYLRAARGYLPGYHGGRKRKR